jgi:hypothetical protein
VEVVSDEPGKDRYGNRALMHPENYVVTTHRLDGAWTHYVEFQGVVWRLPGKVFERMRDQRASIITEQRRASAQERHDRMARLAEDAAAAEAVAEAERLVDLGGQ